MFRLLSSDPACLSDWMLTLGCLCAAMLIFWSAMNDLLWARVTIEEVCRGIAHSFEIIAQISGVIAAACCIPMLPAFFLWLSGNPAGLKGLVTVIVVATFFAIFSGAMYLIYWVLKKIADLIARGSRALSEPSVSA
jgi:hypothetical protein